MVFDVFDFDGYDAMSREQLIAECQRLRQRAENLEIALTTNRQIAMAVGILMEQRRLTADAGFDLLTLVSQRTHRKVRDVADEVVLTGMLPEETEPSPAPIGRRALVDST